MLSEGRSVAAPRLIKSILGRAGSLAFWIRTSALPRLLPADECLSFLMTDDVSRNALRVAATLGIPDLIQRGVNDAQSIATAVAANPDAVSRLLRHLAARGVFAVSSDHTLRLTKVGFLLTSGHPSSRRSEFDVNGAGPRFERALSGMLHSIRTGESAYEEIHGQSLWEQMTENPSLMDAFDSEMEHHARSTGAELLSKYPWNRYQSVADVGGGTGALLRVILDGNPHLKGTVIEMSDAVHRARRTLSDAGLSNRSDVVDGSFFDALPISADIYILSWILHDWNDRDAIRILRRCREGLKEGGRVLIIEKLLDRHPDTAMDLRMLVYFGGKERYLSEYEDVIGEASLALLQTIDLANGFCVLECGVASPMHSPPPEPPT
jgi:SAM-dependent methyltransferase